MLSLYPDIPQTISRLAAFACAQVLPTPTSDLENHLMVPYGKVCDIYGRHEALGFKLGIIAQRIVHPLVKADVDFRSCLCNSRYREVI